jgi:glycosyltransferase involved in cell wall biosynthesis
VPSRPLRVTILNWRDTGHPEGGGSERFVERVAAGLAADGCDVVLQCARYPGSARREVRDGFVLRRAGGRLTVYPRALLALVGDRLRRRHADVVLEVQNGVPFLARLVAGCPTVVLVHHVHREQWPVALGPVAARVGWWIESVLAPRALRGCSYVTVSDTTRRELVELGVRGADVSVVHNGVDPVPAFPLPRPAGADMAPRLVVLGRLVPHKRVEHALEVLARLLPEVPGLRLQVIGEGWWHGPLVARAEELGVSGAVDVTGFVPEVVKHELLAGASVLLAPSLKEGWGLMVIEAGQHAVPAVAYRQAGGITESVVDGVTGVLVDDLDELVAATRGLLADRELRDRLGAGARRHAASFSWRATTTAMLGVLRHAAAGRRVDLPPAPAQPAGALPDVANQG